MRKLTLSFLCLVFAAGTLFSQRIPEAKGFVNDFSNVLTASQESQLNALLTHYAETSGNEIAIVIIELPQDEVLEDYTYDIAEAWGVGGKANDNGILVAVYPAARQMRIEVGYGLEGAVPDIIAKEVMDNYMRPAFRANDYYTGIRDASEALIAATNGEYENAPTRTYYTRNTSPGTGGNGGQIVVIIMIIILFSIMNNRGRGGGKGGGKGGRGSGGMWLPWIFMGGGGHHGGGGGGFGGGGGGFGGGGGGFGGGGFGGFGGGGFGGGGASGGW